MLYSLALILVMFGLTAFFLRDRIYFYLNTKDIAASPLGIFNPDYRTPTKPNVDLGFISFHLELSAGATIKKSDSGITIKDQGRTLVINLPEIFAEMQPNPNYPDDIPELDRLIDKYGNIVRAQQAAFGLKSDIGVLFCSESDFKCYQSLLMMRLVPTPLYENQEFYATSSFDAIIDTIRSKQGKFYSITWSTKQGKRIDQRRGVIMIGDKLPPKETSWPNQFIYSIIIHPKGNILSVDEMVTRIEKLKQSPAILSGG